MIASETTSDSSRSPAFLYHRQVKARSAEFLRGVFTLLRMPGNGLRSDDGVMLCMFEDQPVWFGDRSMSFNLCFGKLRVHQLWADCITLIHSSPPNSLCQGVRILLTKARYTVPSIRLVLLCPRITVGRTERDCRPIWLTTAQMRLIK